MPTAILAFGTSIVRAFDTPLQVDDREVIVSVSVGASVFPDHERDAEALLRAADAALFRAKALGRSQLATFTPELLVTASAKFAIEQRLRRAIQGDEFELFYQPLINTETLDVALVEALIRWRMPDGSYPFSRRIPRGGRGVRPDRRDQRLGAAHRHLHRGALASRTPGPRRASRSTSRRGSSWTIDS